MRPKWFASLLFLLLLSLPAAAQQPEAYFSLTALKTFRPGEKVSVRLYARGVDGLEFRVYKVNDALAFFQKLEDAHNFGRTAPREQVETPTFLERFHDWKRLTWFRIRNFFRAQYTVPSRARIREASVRPSKSTPVNTAVFAQVPLLNGSQLVTRWRQSMPSRYWSESEVIPVNNLSKGAYLVEATDGTLRAYTVLMISDIGLITKSAPGQVVAFVADRQSGAPVPGAMVHFWVDKREIARMETDSSGLAERPIPRARIEDVRMVAVHGDDIALTTPYSYSVSTDPSQQWIGYVYTDRPVYRPGHTVHFRLILRAREGEKYLVPQGQQVQLQIEDPTSKQVLQNRLVVSSFGTVHGEWTIPSDAALGYYGISANIGGVRQYSLSGGFQVEEYKKPEYEVQVHPSQGRVLQGSDIDATIEAKYYFGEPVAGANVKYVVYTSQYWSPFIERDEDEEIGNTGEDSEDGRDQYEYAGEQLSEQSARLDSDGKLTIHIPTRPNQYHGDIRYRIEARVTDAGNREISGASSVLATYGSFAVGISAQSYVYKVGETIRVRALARDYDGRPVVTPLHIEMIRPPAYGTRDSGTVLSSVDAQTGEDGGAEVMFGASESGSLRLKVTARTPEGRTVTQMSWLWITGASETSWGGNTRQIRIVSDKKSYQVGDTARLLILTGVPDAYVLLTSEGRSIRNQKIVHATAPSVTVDVPLGNEDQPNVYISAVFLRDNQLFQSSKSLKVPAVQQRLQIEIQPAKEQFQPAEKASYTIMARDAAGKPVAGEFSIGVVDEAIYAIQPDAAGDIHNSFYGPVYDRVSTESSLSFYFNGEAGKRQMFLAGLANPAARLAQLKPSEPLAQPRIRKEFPDTALWLADVRTDSNGIAHAQLNFPDSLTTWRATVRGITTDTKVGSSINRVIVRKNLMVRLAVPRFFRQGDEVTVSAIVHNYLTAAQNVRVSLEVKGLEVIDGATRQVDVASKAEAKVDWKLRAQSVAEANLVAKALATEESDALELTLPVIPFGVRLTEAKSGALSEPEQQEDQSFDLPGDFAQSAPSINLTLSSSVAGSLFGALDFLTSYPYGCTEQTMSSFLPNIVVAKAMRDLRLQTTLDAPELQKKIRAGMERLQDFQHEDGGWGWWKEDESLVFMTAYVISGYGQARAAGYEVNDGSLARGRQWLLQTFDRFPDMRPDLRAYVVYALSLNGASRPDIVQTAWEKRDAMSVQGLALLGLALQNTADSNRAREIAAKLETLATVTQQEAHWTAPYDYLMEFELDDSAETTAYALQLLSHTSPASPLLPKAAFWLVNHRNGGYYWDSTKQTAMVIFGLTDYLKATHELEANFLLDVYLNGKQVTSRRFTAADAFNPVQPRLQFNADQLRPGQNTIRLHKSGPGKLYWSAASKIYSSEKRFVQRNKLSLNITRDYFVLAPVKAADKITYQLNPLSGTLKVGDVVAVRLTVGGGEWRYLLIEDPIPAGSEFIQRDDLYELQQRPDWWESWFVRREFHDDRAAFFQTYFNQQHQYVYLIKIVNPGKFRTSPAVVQPMYQTALQATTDAATVEVQQ